VCLLAFLPGGGGCFFRLRRNPPSFGGVNQGELPIMSIENPTLAHFRHFSSLFTPSPLYICRETSTNQLLFMQNKPNFPKSQMNVNPYNTMTNENKSNWTLGQNKPNSKPISSKANMNANAFSQKDYEIKTAFRLEQNKPLTNFHLSVNVS